MSIKKKILTLASFTIIAVSLCSQVVTAKPDTARIVTYYSDATRSVEVGEGGVGCETGYSWGQKTAYYTVETFKCSDGVWPRFEIGMSFGGSQPTFPSGPSFP
ncbi:MAG: hypothetical protein HY253_08895 [Burkholderiales bacterium]|nr:hypothetical protein [Burkholderiales bacterium]